MNNLTVALIKKYLIEEMNKNNELAVEADTMKDGIACSNKANTLQEVLNEVCRIEVEVITGKEMGA